MNNYHTMKKDFPPLYLILMLVGAGLVIIWGFLLVGGYQLAVVDLPSTEPQVTINTFVIFLQFIFCVVAFIGVLRYALLKIKYKTYKESAEATNDSLRKQLQEYEREDIYDEH